MLDMVESRPVGSAPKHSPGASSRHRECGSHSAARWFVVQSHPKQETTAQREIINQGIQSFVPLVAVQRSRAVELVPLFPGYLFALFDPTRDRWRPLCSTRGVKALMGSAPDRPTPVPSGVVEHLLATQSLRAVVQDIAPLPIAPGSRVRVGAGPFADQMGICLWSDERRVRLLLEILGGMREIELGRTAVTPE